MKVVEEMGSNNASSHVKGDHTLHIHKVGAPPKQKLVKGIKDAARETFFSDHPLCHLNDKPISRKLVLGLKAVFPILEWGRDYSFHKFRGDLVSGLTIASLCIPQDIAYAKLANLDPQYAL
ncbi:high affinity sulfate transporter 2-like, partial [Neltuma alba]